MMATAQDSGAPRPPSIQRSWLAMADGLHVQRVHLHVAEWRQLIEDNATLPDVGDGMRAREFADTRSVRPADETGRPATRSHGGPGSPWVDIAARLATTTSPGDSIRNPLSESADARARGLVEASNRAWVQTVQAACASAAWWVGFFTVIRHRGVHHATLHQDKPPVTLAVLHEATDIVALGLGLRALEARVREVGVADGDVMAAYCRAITATIAVEARLPGLLDDLSELRLVDLVTLSVPWRGRFTKYSGGTGAGQVE